MNANLCQERTPKIRVCQKTVELAQSTCIRYVRDSRFNKPVSVLHSYV